MLSWVQAEDGMQTREAVRFLQTEVSRLRDENRELKDELTVLRSSVRALSALQDILQRLGPGTDLIALLNDLLVSALAVVGAKDGSLLLVDEESGDLVFAVVLGEARDRLTGYHLPPGQGIAGWVALNRQAQVVHDVHADPRFYPDVDEASGFRTRTLACVPLVDGDRLLGVIEAINKTADRAFTEEDNDLLAVVAQLASIAITRAETFSEQPTRA
jgi:GAF domain-containing protein